MVIYINFSVENSQLCSKTQLNLSIFKVSLNRPSFFVLDLGDSQQGTEGALRFTQCEKIIKEGIIDKCYLKNVKV